MLHDWASTLVLAYYCSLWVHRQSAGNTHAHAVTDTQEHQQGGGGIGYGKRGTAYCRHVGQGRSLSDNTIDTYTPSHPHGQEMLLSGTPQSTTHDGR